MTRYVVKMFGLPSSVTELRETEVDLEDGVRLGDVVVALKREIPALEGSVIRTGKDRLVENYAFNVNGRFYFDYSDLQLRDGDRIALLILATGG